MAIPHLPKPVMKIIFVLLFLLLIYLFVFSGSTKVKLSIQNSIAPKKLRVMTFNIWMSGKKVEDGLTKIVKHIKTVDADVVALQEVSNSTFMSDLTRLLGKPWNGIHNNASHGINYPDTAILTKHTFVNLPPVKLTFELTHNTTIPERIYGTGVTIQLSSTGGLVNFFAMHLLYDSAGLEPWNLIQNNLVSTAEQIMAIEKNAEGNGRAQNIEGLLKNDRFKEFLARTDKEPLIVAGDFNCPSHLDWTEEYKGMHSGWAFEWPATKQMTDNGFIDSYRHLHPDVRKDPGHTWSTVLKISENNDTIPEAQDRIDFIFYRGPKNFNPISSQIYSGDEPLKPIPNHWKNFYPSDHFAVITDFTFEENKAI